MLLEANDSILRERVGCESTMLQIKQGFVLGHSAEI